ncbi:MULTISPECIES: hypothetical protein [unclassified Nocardia]|uniref:hypothetical protein n=1 Tax=unclassified Nocardia TaxID=2637762 RepID=UPI0035E005ED
MFAVIARSAIVAAIAVPLVALTAPTAFADEPATPTPDQTSTSTVIDPLRRNADAPYIWISFCVHIPTPGSATLDWCWTI